MRSCQSSVLSCQSETGPASRWASAPGFFEAGFNHGGTEARRGGDSTVAWALAHAKTPSHSTVSCGLKPTRLSSSPCLRASVGKFFHHTLVLTLLLLGLTVSPTRADDPLLDKPLRHLFVPLEEFDAVMARDRQGTLLKRAEFETLIESAIKNKTTEIRPSGLVVSSANYTAKIDGDQMVLTATIQFTNFEKIWSEFHIPCDGLSVEKCQINGQPALAGWHGENPNILRVFTDVQGAGTLTLELSTRMTAVGSDLAVGFGAYPAAASGELVVSLPAGKFLMFEGANLQRNVAADQPAEYRVSIGGRRNVALQITNRQTSTRTDSLTLVNTAIAVTVAPGEVAWSAKAALQIVGRPVDRVVCTVPQSLEITAVESTGLDSWQLAATPDDPARTTITLAYRQPFDGSREINFRGVLKAASDMAWEVPTLAFNDITSQVGIAEVRYPPGVRLRVGELDGIRTVVSQAVTAENGDSLLHFQIWKPRFKLPFVTEPKTREVRAAVTNLLDINAAGLDFTSVINLQTRLAPLFDAQINLPAQWQIRSVFLGDQPITWQIVPQEAGVNQIRITFPTPIPADGTVAITVNAGWEPEKWPVEDAPAQIVLPRLQLPQASVIEGLFGITAEAALDVVPTEVAGLDPPNPTELELLRQKIAAAGRIVRLGFSLQDSEYKGQLNVTRKPARLSSHESTFFRIEPDTLNTHIESQLKIEGGGVRQLFIDLPEASGTDLRFVLSPYFVASPLPVQQSVSFQIPPKIVEQTAAPAKNGIRRWTLRFDRYANDTYLLSVDIRQPRPEKGPFNCPVFSVVGAERETGFVAIEASQEQFLSPLATDVSGQPLLKVDPIDFPPAAYLPKEPVVAGFRYTRPGWALAVGEQRFNRAQVPTAIGHSASYKTVYGRNGELQHQADLEFTAIGIQNLKVRLPAEVTLWSVQMDSQPQEIRRQADGLLVAVPQDGQADRHHALTLFYRSSLPTESTAEFRQVPPAFTVLDGQGAEQPLNILKQSWNLFHPDNLLLIDSPGAFQPTADVDRDGSLGQWRSLLRAPNPTQMRDAGLLVAILFLVVWGLRKTVERFGWLRSLCGVAVMAIATALILPATQNARESARSASGAKSAAMQGGTDIAFTVTAPAPISGPTWESRPLPGPGGGGGFGGGGRDLSGAMASDKEVFSNGPMAPMSEAAPTVDAPADAGAAAAPPAPMAATPSLSDETRDQLTESLSMSEKQLRSLERAKDQAPSEKPMDANQAPAIEGEMPGQPGSNGQQQFRPSKRDDHFSAVIKDAAQGDEFESKNSLEVRQTQTIHQGNPAPTAKLGGLLSLALSLTAPENSRERSFEFLGNGSASTDLHLKFVSRDKSRDWTAFVMAAVVVIGWFCRKLPLSLRGAMIALLILGSIAIAPLLPTRCQPIIDGLFFGGWAQLIMLIVCFILKRIKCRCCSDGAAPPTTPLTTLAVLLALCLAPSLALADEPAPVSLDPHVVLPYTGDDPSTSDRVYIPQDLYLELYKRAHPEEATKPAAPIEGWVVEALHAASFEQTGDTAVVHVKSRMVLITTGDTQFAQLLPLREVALTNAVLDGKPAALQADGGGYKVIVNQPGLHVLDVEFDLPAITEGPAGRFVLKALPTAAAKLSVQLPKIMGDRDLRVNGATGAYRLRETEAGPVLDTVVDRGGDITVSWQPRAIRGGGNTIVHVDSGESIIVDDTGLQVNHHFSYRVRQGAITEVTFNTTPAMAIREISGPDVGGWQLDDANGTTRRLRVFLRRTVEDQTLILIDQFAPLPVTEMTQTLPIPELVPMDATREIGQIGLFAGGEFALRAVDVKGAVQIDVGKYQPVAMPHRPEVAPLAAYRFATRPASLSLSISRKQPETRCVAEHGVLIGTRKLEWASRFVFDLTGAPRPSVSVSLPPDYLLMDVEGADFINDWYDSPGEAGRRTLTIEFDQPRLGQVEILLHGLVPRKVDTPSIDLLAPQTIGVAKLNSSLAVWLSDIYSATVKSSEGWKTSPPEQLSNELQHLRSTPIQFAFRANAATNQPVVVDLTRQVAQLSADLVTLVAVAVAGDSVDYGLTFRWKITRAAADTFQFTTPSWLLGRLELNVPGVRQISSAATEDGDILWTIQLIDAVRNQFLCTGVVTLPPPADDVVQLPDVQFLETVLAGKQNPLESQRRCAIVVNRSAGQLIAVDDRLVNKLPADQLPLVVNNALLKQALAITELSGQQALPKWKLVRTAVQDTGRATVTGSDLVSSIAWDGAWKTRATYTVRNRGQQFLGLRLPDQAQLLSVFVKGRPSRTVVTKLKERTVHLVPLPQTSVVDLSFDVQVTLGGQLPAPLEQGSHLLAQEVSLPAPDVVTRDESADFGLTVAYTSWRVYTPDKLDVTLVSDGKRSNVEQLNQEQVFALMEMRKSERMEADLKELVQITTDKRADNARRAQAQGSIKQLESLLTLQCATIESNAPSKPESVELYEQAKSFNGRLLDEAKKNSVDLPAVQQAVPDVVNATDNRSFIISNNDANYFGNSVKSEVPLGDISVQFKGAVADKKWDRAEAKGKQSGGRGALRKSLENQSYGNAMQGGQLFNAPQSGGGGMPGNSLGVNRYLDKQQLNQAEDVNGNGVLDIQVREGRTGRLMFGDGASGGDAVRFRNPRAPSNGVDDFRDNPIDGRDLSDYTMLNAKGLPAWTQTGGLSLPIDLPTVGSNTVFSKVGGSPMLTLSIRPRQAWTRSLTWLWSLCWGLLALWVVNRIRRAASAASLRPVLGLIAVLGVLGFVLLDGDLSDASLVVFVVSLIAVMLIGVKRAES